MAVIQLKEVVTAKLASEIKRLIANGEYSLGRSEQCFMEAGQHLKELKARKPDGVTWETFVKEQCDISKRRADQLIALAEGRTTLSDMREANREAAQRFRDKQKEWELRNSQRPQEEASDDIEDEEEDDEPDEPCPGAVIYHAREACHWANTIVEDAHRIKPNRDAPLREMLEAAQAAVEAWSKAVAELKKLSR